VKSRRIVPIFTLVLSLFSGSTICDADGLIRFAVDLTFEKPSLA